MPSVECGLTNHTQEYLYNLASAVRELSPESYDKHLFALEVGQPVTFHVSTVRSSLILVCTTCGTDASSFYFVLGAG
jgi:hypothetical protein